MKKFLISMVAMMTIASAAMAQDTTGKQRPAGRPDKEQMAQMQTERMAQNLELNEAQKAKLLDLNKEYADVFQFMRPPHRNGGHHPQAMKPGTEQQARPQAPQGENKMQRGEGRHRPDEAQMKKMHERREKYEAELAKILTPEQLNKYQEQKKNHKPHMRKRDN